MLGCAELSRYLVISLSRYLAWLGTPLPLPPPLPGQASVSAGFRLLDLILARSASASAITLPPLQPVQTPLQIAQSYNIDLLGPFPESKNGNHKLHISVDRFSRRIWLIPVPITITSAQLAEKFVNEVLLKGGRGIPLSLVSDNDTLFTAKYWETMFKHFGTKLCF